MLPVMGFFIYCLVRRPEIFCWRTTKATTTTSKKKKITVDDVVVLHPWVLREGVDRMMRDDIERILMNETTNSVV